MLKTHLIIAVQKNSCIKIQKQPPAIKKCSLKLRKISQFCEFCENSKNIFFTERLLATASENSRRF